MANYERKDGDISVFPNRKKLTEKHPDYTGTLLLNGVEYEVALWERISQKGNEYKSGCIKPKRELQSYQAVPPQPDSSPFGT